MEISEDIWGYALRELALQKECEFLEDIREGIIFIGW
jgi:hypothetical protein